MLLRHRYTFQQVITRTVRQGEVHHDAVERAPVHFVDGLRNRPGFHYLDRRAFQQRVDALAQRGVVLDDQHAPHALRRTRFQLADRTRQRFACAGFERVANGAEMQRDIGMIRRRHDVDRNVARKRIVLEPFEHGQARLVGQTDIEQDAVRLQVAG